jgi:hypothetical protein
MQTSLDNLRSERRNGVTRADIARYNTQTLFCTQYIEVAIVNSAAAKYIGLEKGENFYGVSIGTDWRATADLAIRSQRSGGTVHCKNNKKFRYQKLLGEHVDNTHHFVPFVVEATGPAASKFLDKVMVEAKTKKRKQIFLSQLGAVIAPSVTMQ